jgi:hypothetical protein
MLNDAEKKLFNILMERLDDVFACAGCNDFDIENPTPEDIETMREIWRFDNKEQYGEPEMTEEEIENAMIPTSTPLFKDEAPSRICAPDDHAVLSFIRKKIMEENDNGKKPQS